MIPVGVYRSSARVSGAAALAATVAVAVLLLLADMQMEPGEIIARGRELVRERAPAAVFASSAELDATTQSGRMWRIACGEFYPGRGRRAVAWAYARGAWFEERLCIDGDECPELPLDAIGVCLTARGSR